ncbi:MAG: pallilysin-related adhesin, partial [Treponema sp.]|nr:pallilysin-related adhesin [Treponema sp.]
MAKNNALKLVTILVFLAAAGLIAVLLVLPSDFFRPQGKVQRQTRIVIPHELSEEGFYESGAERMAYEDSMNAKIALNDGELLVSVLNQDFDRDQQDEQVIAYRNLSEPESPIYITYADYDNLSGGYKRIWDAPTLATRPGTISLYTQDMIGDRSICVLLSGMNGAGEHTLTIFRKNDPASRGQDGGGPEEDPLFTRIAALRIDGSIIVREEERTQAYQMGVSGGHSFSITAYGRDKDSANIMDQIEAIYTYDPIRDHYEQKRITRLPGSQIEQRRVQDLLSGDPRKFEAFIEGLWYYVSPQGTVDSRQYIYFDPDGRELIFYGEETQQVFVWQNSGATRYGIYISSQNISVTTLRRFIDIELESLESVKIKVFEDVRLKIGVSASWDGSYRKAGTFAGKPAAAGLPVVPHLDALYDGSIGRLRFSRDGSYELQTGESIKGGSYTFFELEGREFLELRPENNGSPVRETYLVESAPPEDEAGQAPDRRQNLTLIRVQLGVKGIQ